MENPTDQVKPRLTLGSIFVLFHRPALLCTLIQRNFGYCGADFNVDFYVLRSCT
jgi:hypothetical protein